LFAIATYANGLLLYGYAMYTLSTTEAD